MHCTSKSLLTAIFRPLLHQSRTFPPSFLIPSINTTQTTLFSTSSTSYGRKDRNPIRGISALRHTGLRKRQKLSVKLENLPQPVLDPRERSAVEVDEEHGLWDFFNRDRDSLRTPAELAAHGRAWSVPELREKDWDDLWRLWWMCVKERNTVVTFLRERERIGKLLGDTEAAKRMRQTKRTQKAIKHVLTERWYTWENARYAAMDDPEVDLYADPDKGEPAYTPIPVQEEDYNASTEAENPDQLELGTEGGGPPPLPESGRLPSETRV